MTEPKIYYGTMEQSLHKNAQYIFMEAGLLNGTYNRAEFVDRINKISFDRIEKEECKRDLQNQKLFLESMSHLGETVTIKDFMPNRKDLVTFVNTTFREMRDRLMDESRSLRE